MLARRFLRVIVFGTIIAALSMRPMPGFAASIERLEDLGDDGPSVFVISGQLEYGDHIEFRRVIEGAPNGLVLFNSPGGDLRAGLEIGKLIRFRGFATAVPNSSTCVSACALAWMGGTPRAMHQGGLVGFHAAFVEADGSKSEVGSGNAIVGVYFANLGLSEHAVETLTTPGPDQIYRLTPAAAGELGIPVAVYGDETPAPDRTTEDAAAAYVAGHFDAGNSWTSQDAERVARERYAEHVNYYGTPGMARDEIAKSISNYVGRYPSRRTTVRDIRSVRCDGVTCVVVGVADFFAEAPSRNVRVRGSVQFQVRLQAVDGRVLITAENSDVLEKTTEPIDLRAAEIVRDIQHQLQRLGCEPGIVDGVWGPASRAALARFNEATRSGLDLQRLSGSTVAVLRAARAGVCRRIASRK